MQCAHVHALSQLRIEIKNRPFVILSGDSGVPGLDVSFVNVVQFTFKHCNYFFPLPLGLAILKHVLTPRVKATHVAIDTMKDYLDAVYDVTVAYEGTVDHKGQRKLAPSMTGELMYIRYATAICLLIYRTNFRCFVML